MLGATELKQKRPDVQIIMHQADLGIYQNVDGQCRDFGVPAPAGALPLPKPDAFVADGDVIQWAPSFKIRCIHCPGHTPGSTAFHFEVYSLRESNSH